MSELFTPYLVEHLASASYSLCILYTLQRESVSQTYAEKGNPRARNLHKEHFMFDVIYLALGIGLFFIGSAYVRFCERL